MARAARGPTDEPFSLLFSFFGSESSLIDVYLSASQPNSDFIERTNPRFAAIMKRFTALLGLPFSSSATARLSTSGGLFQMVYYLSLFLLYLYLQRFLACMSPWTLTSAAMKLTRGSFYVAVKKITFNVSTNMDRVFHCRKDYQTASGCEEDRENEENGRWPGEG